MRGIFSGLSVAAWIALILNFLSLCFYFAYSSYDVLDHLFRYGVYEWSDNLRVIALAVIAQIATCVCIILNNASQRQDSLIGLWFKRRKMEEERRIRELETKS